MDPLIIQKQTKNRKQRIAQLKNRFFLLILALPLFLLLVLIVLLVVRTQPLSEATSIWQTIWGQTWHPNQGEFGYLPFIAGTAWVTLLAMLLAVPPSLLVSLYLAEYASPRISTVMKALLDILAGIPSVVYGVWGMVTIVPMIRDIIAPALIRYQDQIPLFSGDSITGFSVLAGGIVLAVMVAPIIISVSHEVLSAVPVGLRQASFALGANRIQTALLVVLRKAFPGIVAAIVLGFSRAMGETMAVLMVVGNVVCFPKSLFDPAYPLTALIANSYGEMMSIPLYDAALMGAALVLLVISLVFNLFSSLYLWRKRERWS